MRPFEENPNKALELNQIQQRLRECIKNAPFSQKEIAMAIGVSPQTVSKYMKLDIFPALDTLAKLCKFIDVKSDYILGLFEY
ncbi:MAG: helix-turn-helix transcriptional regulator [Clostridia bacterium]|nr:helix-turn-helix transcriptional regulator [Clostridia bacterium]